MEQPCHLVQPRAPCPAVCLLSVTHRAPTHTHRAGGHAGPTTAHCHHLHPSESTPGSAPQQSLCVFPVCRLMVGHRIKSDFSFCKALSKFMASSCFQSGLHFGRCHSLHNSKVRRTLLKEPQKNKTNLKFLCLCKNENNFKYF